MKKLLCAAIVVCLLLTAVFTIALAEPESSNEGGSNSVVTSEGTSSESSSKESSQANTEASSESKSSKPSESAESSSKTSSTHTSSAQSSSTYDTGKTSSTTTSNYYEKDDDASYDSNVKESQVSSEAAAAAISSKSDGTSSAETSSVAEKNVTDYGKGARIGFFIALAAVVFCVVFLIVYNTRFAKNKKKAVPARKVPQAAASGRKTANEMFSVEQPSAARGPRPEHDRMEERRRRNQGKH